MLGIEVLLGNRCLPWQRCRGSSTFHKPRATHLMRLLQVERPLALSLHPGVLARHSALHELHNVHRAGQNQ